MYGIISLKIRIKLKGAFNLGWLIGIVVFLGLAGALGRRTLRGSKDEQLQELERVKSNSNGFGGGL